MAKQSREDRKLDAQIDALYSVHGVNVQIDIMDISNIFRDSKAALAAGGTLEQGVIDAIAKYRKN